MNLAMPFNDVSLPCGMRKSVYLYGSVLAVSICFALWLLRRLRTPKIYKNAAPPVLPYKIPIVGHTIDFIRNSEALISRGREHFGNVGNVFSLNLLGNTVYVLTDPRHLTAVHNNSIVYSFRSPILETILVSMGVSEKGAQTIMHNPGDVEQGKSKNKSLFQSVHDLQVRQLNGSELGAIAQQIARYLDAKITPGMLPAEMTTQKGTRCLSMKRWVRETQVLAMQNAFFGSKLAEMDDELPENLLQYSRVSWQTWYHVPKCLRQHYKYGHHIRGTFMKWLDLPPDERGATWSTESLIQQFNLVGLTKEDASTFMHFFYWGISMNPANLIFWIFAHIICDPELMDAIREETAPAFKGDEIDTFYLVNSCPRLESVWHECLRLYTSVTSTRYITRDVQLGDSWLSKGHAILFSARQIAFHDEKFGANPLQFDKMRFYDNPQLKHAESHRPFGGGAYACCGKHLTKHVHATFVAIMLRKFNLSAAFPQSFPSVHVNEPSIGVLVSKDDFYINLEPRM